MYGPEHYRQLEDSHSNSTDSWDKVAYVEVGRKYGLISADLAKSPYYDYYIEYEQKWEEFKRQLFAYNADVKLHNQEIVGKVFRKDSTELARIKAWEDRLMEQEKALDTLRQELGDSRFKPLGVVKNTWEHW